MLKPGGRFLSLDFNRPQQPWLREAYLAYLSLVGSALGRVLHGDGDTYRYIAASLRRFPPADVVVDQMRAAGFADVRWTPLLGGLMALHVGVEWERLLCGSVANETAVTRVVTRAGGSDD